MFSVPPLAFKRCNMIFMWCFDIGWIRVLVPPWKLSLVSSVLSFVKAEYEILLLTFCILLIVHKIPLFTKDPVHNAWCSFPFHRKLHNILVIKRHPCAIWRLLLSLNMTYILLFLVSRPALVRTSNISRVKSRVRFLLLTSFQKNPRKP